MFPVGSQVEVENRVGPGWKGGNGGIGRVRNISVHETGPAKYDIKYILNGSEKGVREEHIKIYVAKNEARAGARAEVAKRRLAVQHEVAASAGSKQLITVAKRQVSHL